MVELRQFLLTVIVVGLLAACSAQPSAQPEPTLSPTETPGTMVVSTTTPEPAVTRAVPTATTSPPAVVEVTTPAAGEATCMIGTGMREETVPVLLAHTGKPGLVMAASSQLAEAYFSQLEGWVRVIGAPSLAALEEKAERAERQGTPYEALAYGLETSESTPADEWGDLVASTEKARAIADSYGKLLLMGPGFRLMSANEEAYGPMAALSDIWMFQTQQLQKEPPGAAYRSEVEQLAGLIRGGNPDIVLWAQITLPPDREPDAGEWLAYREAIADLVDGTYLGIYTWRTEEASVLISTAETVLQTCNSKE